MIISSIVFSGASVFRLRLDSWISTGGAGTSAGVIVVGMYGVGAELGSVGYTLWWARHRTEPATSAVPKILLSVIGFIKQGQPYFFT